MVLVDIIPYEPVGPAAQSYGYGWGISEWDGIVSSALTTYIKWNTWVIILVVHQDQHIALTSATGFPTAGRIQVGTELISYTGVSTNNLNRYYKSC